MINLGNLATEIIRPTLSIMLGYSRHINSTSAENMLLLICMVESEYKEETRLRQLRNGPALGIWQMEPATHDSQWNHFISKRPVLVQIMKGFARRQYALAVMPCAEEMVGNLYYACAMARLKIWRAPPPLPDEDDFDGMFDYWNKYYNANANNDEAERKRWRKFAELIT